MEYSLPLAIINNVIKPPPDHGRSPEGILPRNLRERIDRQQDSRLFYTAIYDYRLLAASRVPTRPENNHNSNNCNNNNKQTVKEKLAEPCQQLPRWKT